MPTFKRGNGCFKLEFYTKEHVSNQNFMNQMFVESNFYGYFDFQFKCKFTGGVFLRGFELKMMLTYFK